MRAPGSAKTTLYLLNIEGAYFGAAVEGHSISIYGNLNGDVSTYNSEGVLQEQTVPGSSVGQIADVFAEILRSEFTSSTVLQRSGNIEDLSDYVIISGE